MKLTAKPLARPPATALTRVARILFLVVLLFVFLLGVKGLGDGFKLLGKDVVEAFFRATANPFFALVIGILATTLVQSSSVSTSMIVGLVAAPENPLPLANAVPMIMGANIGTTVTNTIVSLAHIGHKQEFRRAFSAATCHDFFNYIAVLLLLPLELATGLLSRTAAATTGLVVGLQTGRSYESPFGELLSASFKPVSNAVKALTSAQHIRAVLLIVISAAFIFIALTLLVRTMRGLLHARVETGVLGSFGQSAAVTMMIGIIVTIMVQSSSITTSLLIPLAGAGIITLEQAFPITVGANIGTTVTALMASLAVTGENAAAGITIALVHFFFNVIATLVIYPIPAIRRLPLGAARWLADIAVESRAIAIAYVLGLFYIIPAIIAAIDLMML